MTTRQLPAAWRSALAHLSPPTDVVVIDERIIKSMLAEPPLQRVRIRIVATCVTYEYPCHPLISWSSQPRKALRIVRDEYGQCTKQTVSFSMIAGTHPRAAIQEVSQGHAGAQPDPRHMPSRQDYPLRSEADIAAVLSNVRSTPRRTLRARLILSA